MTKMLSFHNKQEVKSKYLNRVRAHAKAENIIQGQGWNGKKGCAIGCTLENYDRTRYPIELGIPVAVAILEDCIFEGLSIDLAKKWPDRFLDNVPVGKDLQFVFPKFALWLLLTYIPKEHQNEVNISKVIKLYKNWAAGEVPDNDALALARARALALALALARARALDLALALALDLALDLDLDLDLALDLDLDRALARARARARNKFWVDCSDKLIEIVKES